MIKACQCKCCWTIHFNDLSRDDKGRCRKCQLYCFDDVELVHCGRVIEIDRISGTLVVVDLAKTFGDHNTNADEMKGCFDCYWVHFPCNGCLTDLFKRNMKLSDIVKCTMTYERYKAEQKIWKPHWEIIETYEEYREKFVLSSQLSM